MLRMGIVAAGMSMRFVVVCILVIVFMVVMILRFNNGMLMHMEHANQEEHRHNAEQQPAERPIQRLFRNGHAMRKQMEHRYAQHEASHAAHEELQACVGHPQPVRQKSTTQRCRHNAHAIAG